MPQILQHRLRSNAGYHLTLTRSSDVTTSEITFVTYSELMVAV